MKAMKSHKIRCIPDIWLYASAVFFYHVLIVRIPFPLGVWDRVWNLIV